MAAQFEKQPTGYLYRANCKGPARPATQQEFDSFVRQGAVSFLLHVAAFMVSVIAAAMLTAHWFPRGGETGGLVLMGGMMLGIGFALYRSIQWAMLAPERALAERSPVAPPKPGHRAGSQPKAMPTTSSPGPRRKIGFWAAIAWTLAELVGGIGSALLVAETMGRLFGAREHGFAIAATGGLLTGALVVFLMERRCRRKYGSGPLDILEHIRF
ncbi:hypothetical protein [Allosphingosinicella deserti]|nr:hypothetical protein [Sphingomonas deserti]